MAAVSSLGVHSPVALPYLVSEGILPNNPKEHEYQWETHVVQNGEDDIEEELLATKNAVAWSQGRFIRNVYRFDLEGEDVKQALFAKFPFTSKVVSEDTPKISGTTRTPRKRIRLSTSLDDFRREEAQPRSEETLARALVVLLKTKAHIYFLHGASHIVHLPFEVERAFTAPRGVIFQRKRTAPTSLPPTPMLPNAPPNSFWSSQLQQSQSLLHSPTFTKGLPNTRPAQPSRLGGDNRLEALFQSTIVAPSRESDEDVTNLYSLTSPLSDLGVVTYSIQHHKSRLSSKAQLSVEFEGLDPGEKVIYVSTEDELLQRGSEGTSQLGILVTANHDINTVMVWHMWYKDEKSLRVLLKQRAEHKAAKARRRSSFISANIGTGSTTPAVRPRDKPRESFVGVGLTNSQGEPTGSQGAGLSRKQTRQEEEAVMASQMDPDFQPAATQQPARENRRVSSINADVRASQNTVNSFAGTGGRRVTSFGGEHGRRSLSVRKSRGSTPGSVYGHSLGGEDDSMDLDTTIEFDPEESLDGILRHIRATYDTTGIDDVFGSTGEGFKRELIVRKIHSFAVGLRTSAFGSPDALTSRYKVATLSESPSINGIDDTRVRLYLHDRQTKELQYVALKIKHRQIWPELSQSPRIAIPMLTGENRMAPCDDIAKLRDGQVRALLLGDNGLQFSLDEQRPCPLPQPASYRVYDPLELGHVDIDAKETGKNRTVNAPSPPVTFEHIGSQGRFDEVGTDGVKHRRRLRLQPRHVLGRKILTLCELMLPKHQARAVRKIWCVARAQLERQPAMMAGTSSDADFVATVSMIFTFVLGILDSKARAAINLSKVALGKAKSAASTKVGLQKVSHSSSALSSSVWSWLPSTTLSASQMSPRSLENRKDQLLIVAAVLAEDLVATPTEDDRHDVGSAMIVAARLMLALHVFREEQKLCTLSLMQMPLAPVIAQLGSWLGLHEWGYETGKPYCLEGASEDRWAYIQSVPTNTPRLSTLERPITVFQWFEHALQHSSSERHPSLYEIAQMGTDAIVSKVPEHTAKQLTPRIVALSDLLAGSGGGLITTPAGTIELLAQKRISSEMLETLPEAIAAPFREAIACCEKEPPTTWRDEMLRLVGREDLNTKGAHVSSSASGMRTTLGTEPHDVQSVCHSLEHSNLHAKTREAGRHSISQLIFSDDRRLVEATSLMHFNTVQVGHCPKQPEWDEQAHFEHQRKVMHFVTTRMIALPAGDGMLHFDSQTPLLTEKFHLPGFSSSCIMQPMGHTLTADRSGLTEEKVNWAYFHAGASAGLRISRNVKGIDTSWIAFNKPVELTNRHAGFLLALGVGGHLRHMAKWLSFKYLTPKHTMTSVGLLLGLSASHIGTMDGLITRMLSVHITKMLPPGAAELNVSPATQTAGLMGIGLLYYNTQHRRMSEVMLSEIEYLEVEDPDSGPDPLRDECYRLAAGFALGFINLAKGRDLRGLHGMQLPERLLAMAVGPRPVNAVHVFDRATAGAVMALAMVYMKSGDQAIANKIDIPDSEAQFDQVRPDVLMLRSMAKHVIMWNSIEARGPTYDQGWIQDNLPACYKNRSKAALDHMLTNRTIDSKYVPLFNVFTGLAWALSLKYAGSGNTIARDEILTLLSFFHRLSEGADAFYFDGKLARSALRRCMDVLALSAATVMAGTGDLQTFRYLRRMHGRTDPDTPYGSHFSSHLAIGVLFLGGGTFTLTTSDLALAAMMVSFYPIFPIDVHDNRVHLQAFRHLWTLAAEARCIVIEDIDTQRPIHMPIIVTLRNGELIHFRAPCLLPELHSIATVQTNDPKYWRVTLDFEANPAHLEAFRKDQHISVRRCPATEAHDSIFTAALAALSDMSLSTQPHMKNSNASTLWQTVLSLPAFEGMDKADVEMLLPPEISSSIYTSERTTVVDDRLVLSKAVNSDRSEDLWNLRGLFAWAERIREAKEQMYGGGRHMLEDEQDERDDSVSMRWLGEEVIQEFKAGIEERARAAA
ncbi:Negative regulator of mitosis [Pseudocercospora fuligena]|uniref:Negative regulator of mitosis n=1 Tax=Pseudocercospora fuligena TaxID=685502 RepID=A0A8H6VNE1_9PEZI|nr:Negative regulator of mitosis [Pseudocercospora fuligena]